MEKNHKLFFAGVSVAVVVILGLNAVFIPPADVYVPPSSIIWDLEQGDIIYYGLYDSYSQSITNEELRFMGIISKSEVMHVGDLSSDLDSADDLVLMSTVLMGDENIGYEAPMSYDLYNIIMAFDVNATRGTGDYGLESYFSEPSALHAVHSAFYSYILDFAAALPTIESIDNTFSNAPVFESIEELMMFAAMYGGFVPVAFGFNTYTYPTLPPPWKYYSADVMRNRWDYTTFAAPRITEAVSLQTTGGSSHNGSLSFNSLSYIEPDNGGYGISDLDFNHLYWDISPAIEDTEGYRIEFQLNNTLNMDGSTIIKYSMPYHFETIDTTTLIERIYKGENGIILNITGGNLYAQTGEYLWNGATYEPNPDPQSWDLVGELTSLDLNEFLKITLGFGERTYAVNFIDLETLTELTFTDIEYHMDNITSMGVNEDLKIAYSNGRTLSPDAGSEGARHMVFNPYNFHEFSITYKCPTAGEVHFDNFDITFGRPVYYMYDNEYFYKTPDLVSAIFDFAFSFYHLMFLPRDFNYEIFSWVFGFLNSIWGYLKENMMPPEVAADLPNYIFTISNNETHLNIKMESGVFETLWEMIWARMLGSDGLQHTLGQFIATFELQWDKQYGFFQYGFLEFTFPEIAITHRSGIELVATTMEGDAYPSTIPARYSITDKIGALTDGILAQLWAQYKTTIILYTAGVIAASIAGMYGVDAIIKAIRKRRS